MKISPRFLILTGAAVVALAVSLPFVRGAQTATPTPGEGAGLGLPQPVARFLAGFGVRLHDALAQHPLTPEQRQQIVTVLKNHREQIVQQLEARQQVQRELGQAAFARPPNEARIHEVSGRLANVIADGAILRGKIAADIRPLLTADQKAALRSLAANRSVNANALLGDQ
jgi:Spy/CpxP family protein refolding chaperone